MAEKFFGAVGFAHSERDKGITTEVITERSYYGEVQNNLSVEVIEADKVNPDTMVSHSISIVADDLANEHFSAIRFVEWAGSLWRVTNVQKQRPRLILRLGGVYNGARATPDTP